MKYEYFRPGIVGVQLLTSKIPMPEGYICHWGNIVRDDRGDFTEEDFVILKLKGHRITNITVRKNNYFF